MGLGSMTKEEAGKRCRAAYQEAGAGKEAVQS